MTIFLLLLATGLGVAVGFMVQRLQEQQNKVSELERKYNGIFAQYQRIKEVEQKYSGLISREDTERQLDQQIQALTQQLQTLRSNATAEEKELNQKILTLQEQLKKLEEQDFVESFGFYESKYNFEEATTYKQRLDEIRDQQKQMLKSKTAAVCHTEWTVAGSRSKGQKMINDQLKLILRAFNGECDAAISKVRYNNIQTMENRIQKAYESLNKLGSINQCEITQSYLRLKLEELYLTHEYQDKKQQEQEEQRQIREQMREEERALRELEKAKEEAEREERRYQEALEKARKEAESATGKKQEKLLAQIEALQQQLAEAEAKKERALSCAQLTKSGHVYVISNLGSFGEDVYKIGMTRRPKPMDRVKELGDASVPFPFDVHAMIFCENAPALENRLHKYFSDRRLNKINERKEFFRVPLSDIVVAVEEIDRELKTCKSTIHFTKVAEAAEYRKTCAKERGV